MVEDLLRTAEPASAAAAAPLRRPWWSRLSRAHAVALATALVAGVLNVVALQHGGARMAVLVAATDLAAGTALDAAAVAPADVGADTPLAGALIPAARLEERRGWLVVRPLRAGEPLRWNDLLDPSGRGGKRAMSVPVEPEHAAGGALRPGDRVDVIAVREGQATWVLTDVEVLAVADPADDGALGAQRPFALTLAVDEAQALRLAWAMHDGAVEVVRATGAPPLIDTGAVAAGPAPGEAAAGGGAP